MISRALVIGIPSILLVGLGAFACGVGSDCDFGECTAPGDGGVGGDGEDGPVGPPPGCDPAADVKDAPKCVVSEFGVFVDGASGSDANPGTKEAPVKTVAAALGKLGGKQRVYVCEGTYAEHVKLTSAVSVFGGFACSSWAYSGSKPKIAPADKGYALHVDKVSASLTVSDLDLASVDATEPGASSVAVFLSESASVLLRRVAVGAGKGVSAIDAQDPPSNLFSENIADLDGNGATGGTGGTAKTCACKSYGSSTGGKGGDGGNPAPNGDNGVSTPMPAAMGGRDGAGGAGYPNGGAFACSPGRPGADGAARAGGKGADTLGALDTNGWTPAAGMPGEAGNPGGGAGGGGGGDVNGSGGGGCGGCGGAGGLGGKGGGASVAIASFSSSLRLDSVTLRAGNAGKGGDGSTGGGGGGGGGGGAIGACGGGRGGNGAGGSGAGGGAGGVSTGIVRKGGSLEGSPQVTLGQKGGPGAGGGPGLGGTNPLGTAPSGSAGTPGRDGAAQDVLVID